jgi:hypothetical protein
MILPSLESTGHIRYNLMEKVYSKPSVPSVKGMFELDALPWFLSSQTLIFVGILLLK